MQDGDPIHFSKLVSNMDQAYETKVLTISIGREPWHPELRQWGLPEEPAAGQTQGLRRVAATGTNTVPIMCWVPHTASQPHNHPVKSPGYNW